MSDAKSNSSASSSSPATPVLVPAERTFIFPRETADALLRATCYFRPPEITNYWTPEAADLAGVEAGLPAFLAAEKWVKRYEWADYYRQVAGLQQGGERTLFLSYFVPEFPPPLRDRPKTAQPNRSGAERWRDEPYWANDGGDTYFRVIYDPRKKEFTWLERNSEP